MKQFKTLSGKHIPDIVEYIREYVGLKEDVEILIGSDSQTYGNKKTVYGVVVALYVKGKGGHVLCSREVVKAESNLSTKLITEVWRSIELAEYLRENGLPKPTWIDIDLNPDPKFKSNKTLREAVGLVEGMGYKCRHKHDGAIMTYAANKLVRI